MSDFFTKSATSNTSKPAETALSQLSPPFLRPTETFKPESFKFRAGACPWLPKPIIPRVFSDSSFPFAVF